MGPTGVGKTETVKVVSRVLFSDDPAAIVRLDMSAYKSVQDMQQFLGTPDTKGDLQTRLEAAGDKGRFLLLDEIEKAHPAFFDLLLQILDEASLRFFNGDVFDFSQYYVWCTTNIGSDLAQKGTKTNKRTIQKAYEQAFRQFMRPELVERFSMLLPYYSLDTDVQVQIASRLFDKELSRLSNKTGYQVAVPDLTRRGILNLIRSQGYTSGLGARRMRKVTQSILEGAFYNAMLQGFSGNLNLDFCDKTPVLSEL